MLGTPTPTMLPPGSVQHCSALWRWRRRRWWQITQLVGTVPGRRRTVFQTVGVGCGRFITAAPCLSSGRTWHRAMGGRGLTVTTPATHHLLALLGGLLTRHTTGRTSAGAPPFRWPPSAFHPTRHSATAAWRRTARGSPILMASLHEASYRQENRHAERESLPFTLPFRGVASNGESFPFYMSSGLPRSQSRGSIAAT